MSGNVAMWNLPRAKHGEDSRKWREQYSNFRKKTQKIPSMVFDVLQYPVSELKIFYCISVLWTKCSISVKNSKKDNCKNKRSGTLGRAFMYASHIWLRNINEVHSSTKSSRGKTKTWNYGFLNIIDYEFSSQITGTSTIRKAMICKKFLAFHWPGKYSIHSQ